MKHPLFTMMYHELLLIFREAFSWITPLLFFIIIVCLFPLALGGDQALLTKAAPGIVWVAALLSILLSISNLFRQDAEEGYLDAMLLSAYPLSLVVLCKIASHWLTHSFPLIIISPLLGGLLNLNSQAEYALVISLLLGTPVLTLLGAIGAALVVGIRGHGLLLPILIMPLYIPVLIFGTGTIMAASNQAPLGGYFAIMGAMMLFTFTFAPFLTGIALRMGVDQ